jgi:hypothetical protein
MIAFRDTVVRVAAFLALLAAVCFACVATMQQRGPLVLARAGRAIARTGGLLRMTSQQDPMPAVARLGDTAQAPQPAA